ncbi:MAG: hypothetical protein IJ191_09430 [Treponema sp.]|nr:hypothetical protein [Treponema sp.]
MYEIELKAHVTDRCAVHNALAHFARADAFIEKYDDYYRIPLPPKTAPELSPGIGDRGFLTARIRTEYFFRPADEQTLRSAPADARTPYKTRCTLTYKRKERRTDASGLPIEVNDEHECTLSDKTAVEKLFTDCGFVKAHTKEKHAESWYAATAVGEAHLELCSVPPLGDFIEIELCSPQNNETAVAPIRAELLSLLDACGVPASAVETRYYSDMLAELPEDCI